MWIQQKGTNAVPSSESLQVLVHSHGPTSIPSPDLSIYHQRVLRGLEWCCAELTDAAGTHCDQYRAGGRLCWTIIQCTPKSHIMLHACCSVSPHVTQFLLCVLSLNRTLRHDTLCSQRIPGTGVHPCKLFTHATPVAACQPLLCLTC